MVKTTTGYILTPTSDCEIFSLTPEELLAIEKIPGQLLILPIVIS